jgi:hypothetical protein
MSEDPTGFKILTIADDFSFLLPTFQVDHGCPWTSRGLKSD